MGRAPYSQRSKPVPRLDLDKVNLSGFKSFPSADLNLRKIGLGLHSIRGRNEVEPRLGSNGAGKSSLFGAVTWASYGRTAEGLRNTDILPWAGRDNTTVNVLFQRDGKPLQIERSASPNRLLLNGRAVAQEDIDHAIGLNFDAFTNTFILGQGRPLFFDLPPRDKLELFTAVLELERWEQRSKFASDTASDLDHKLNQRAAELDALISRIEQVNVDITDAKRSMAEWRHEQEARLDSYETDLEPLQKALEKNSAKRDIADLAYDGHSVSWRGQLDGIRQLNDYLRIAEAEKAKQSRLMEGDMRDLARLKNELAELDSGVKTCPTCGQPVKRTDMAEHKTEVKDKIAELQRKVRANVGSMETVSQQIEDLTRQLRNAERDAAKFRSKSDAAEAELRVLNSQVTELTAKIAAIKKARQERQDERNPYQEQVQTLRRRKTALLEERKTKETEVTQLERRHARTKFWVKGFKDVRLQIIEDVLQELELTTGAMLEEIGLIDWRVQFAVEKETKSGSIQRGINVTILSPRNRNPVRWENWSGGEGQRLRLISALALSDVLLNHAGIEPGFEVLDEPTQHLSVEGIKDLCTYLAERAKELQRQIWLIDHRAIESSQFKSSITVVKTKTGSQIEGAENVVERKPSKKHVDERRAGSRVA